MLVLGWHGGVRPPHADTPGFGYSSHDGAAALVRDGQVIAAIEEERLTRIKHTNFFPAEAIRFCLNAGGVTLADVDLVAFDAQEPVLDEFLTLCALINPDEPLVGGRQWIAALFDRHFGGDVASKLRFCKHHLAHICSAIYPSGFASGLAVALDGEGDRLSGVVASFDDSSIVTHREYSAAQSLGALYTSMISLLGYRRFDEYKVMGLAPYGDPAKYRSLFDQFYTLRPDGDFEIVPDDVKIRLVAEHGLVPHIRRKGQAFTDVHRDLAAAMQSTLETIAMHVFEHFQRVTGATRLAYSGGVAHNCTLNGRLLACGLFDDVFVQPAAHDAGNAIGAALAAARDAGARMTPQKLSHVFFGSSVGSDADVAARLGDWSGLVDAERCEDIAERAAALIAGGAVIGWVQGQSEFGPRALGNRSILADPRPADHKRLINEMVKKREGYRPFAPAVVEERLHDYFDVPVTCARLPFMIFVVRVREHMRVALGAVTHVDGTARVQTVDARTNPRFHALIRAFEARTGVGVLLNTSFNNDAEPIVDSIDDAVACFLTTGIQYLVVGDSLVSRKAGAPAGGCRSLTPRLRAHQKLVRRGGCNRPERRHAIESIANSHFVAQASVDISEDAFELLLSDGRRHPADATRDEALTRELLDLWSRRAITLTPPR